jgi:[ribosomal protein S5]-alanine N-acetyltransferase
MPKAVPAVIVARSLGDTPQPRIAGGAGIVLRPWRTTDCGGLADAFEDPAIAFWHRRTIASAAEAESLITGYGRDWAVETRANWAVVSDTDDLLGRVSLNPMHLEDGEAEIGYWVLSSARGRGVAVTAVALLVSWSFSVGFHRLVIHHSTSNPASCSVAHRTGFHLEGTKKSALLHPDGWHDMHLHARINPVLTPQVHDQGEGISGR